MRILLVTGSFPPMPCGVGDYTSMLARSLAQRKNTRVAVLTHIEGQPRERDCAFDILPGANGWRLAEAGRIARDVRNCSPDVIHFQYPGREYGVLQCVLPMLFRLMGYPVFLTLHEYYAIHGFRSLLTAVLHLPNLFASLGVVVTREEYKELVPRMYARILRRRPIRHIPVASSIPTAPLDDPERLEVRRRYGIPSGPLLSYFGFVSPEKGLEDLIRIADPGRHRIALLCDLDKSDPYQRKILDSIGTPPWKGRVTVTGFLPDIEVGRIMAASDAIVFPFRNGASTGNSSLHGALAQGTFTLTTSRTRHGYDPENNVYFSRPGDIEEMSAALATYEGRRIQRERDFQERAWSRIADAHIGFYTSVVDRLG
jgi:glycosyltransferase involved in cell wall biosynthesis